MSKIDRSRIEAAVRELLYAIGEDPDREELALTPGRVAEAYGEFFAGINIDPADHLASLIPVGAAGGDVVIVRDIELRSMCEHHLLPFRGKCHIAYLPNEQVAGFSSLPRVVETLASRPQLQERLGEQIADVIDRELNPRGVFVMIEARHGCMSDRGIRQTNASAVTVALRGEFNDPVRRSDVMALLGGHQ